MNKTKSPKGVTKNIKYEKQVLRYPQCDSLDKDKHTFKVEENDFPSLSEVREKSPKPEKDSSMCGISLLTYSSKLKTLLAESSPQIMKFESVQHSSRTSKNESTLNKAGSGNHLVKAPSTAQSKHQTFAKQSSSIVPSPNRGLTDSKSNSCFSEVKSKRPESFNDHTDMKMYYGQKSANDSRSFKTFDKNGSSPKKGHNPNKSTSPNIQKSPLSNSLSSSRYTNTVHSAELRSEKLHHKENDRPNINAQHKRYVETNRLISSGAGSSQGVRSLKVHLMEGNVSGNTSNKARISVSSGSQIAYDSLKLENKKTGNQSSNVQSPLAGTSETKKKKKRKSKLKRQAALQTGKILVLTPEVHSKIVNQSNNTYVQKNQNILTNINDNEEYPELGAAEPKTVKESHMTLTNTHIKGENPANLTVFGSETDNKKNLLFPKDSSPNDNLEAAFKSEQKNIGLVEKPEIEKSTMHSNNPITLSLFDMLVTAKPRKKEPEKKVESTDESNFTKVFKKEMTKKNVPQAVNPLASSKPTIKRGKEREKPKVKRPSRMRKLILMERQLRKENMAMKRHEAEDENQENSGEIFRGSNVSQDINEFSTPDNLETCVEILQNYPASSENSNEAFDIFDDLNDETSKQPISDCEDTNHISASKSPTNISENARLINEIMNTTNYSEEKHITNISNNVNKLSSNVSSVLDNEKDFILNSDFNFTNKEENFIDGLLDIDNFTEICSTNLSEKRSELKNEISDTCYIDGNLGKTGNGCQAYSFINREQESEHKAADRIENNISYMPADDVTANSEFNSRKKGDSIEPTKSNGSLDSSEQIVSSILTGSFSGEERLKATKLVLHSRKFRKYCNHFISKEIDQAVFSLINDLARFQDRMYQKDPVKAKIRRRLVYGLKEIKKHMKLKKIKCIIIATDIEDIKIEGGLNDFLGELISLAEAYQIPCVFSHCRFNLGKVCRKSVPVSCVGIFNYEGSEKNFKKMIELHDDSKHDYLEVTKKLASELTNHQLQQLLEAEKESLHFLREVSQRILRELVYFTPEGYRNNETSEALKESNIEFEDSDLLEKDEKSLLFIEEHSEELTKLNKGENLLQLNETDINTILVKYKVVKEC